MADAKLTALTAASALAAADLFYVSQSAASRKATGTQLLALVGTTYVPLAGGTMTGALTLPAGTVSAPALQFTGGGSNTGLYLSGASELSIAVGGIQRAVVDTGGFYATTTAMGMYSNTGYLSLGLLNDIRLYRDAAATLALRNGTTPQTLRVYGTADGAPGSNYQYLQLSANGTTGVTISAVGLGTPGANQDITLTPAGTGRVIFPGGAFVNSNGQIIATAAGLFGAVAVGYPSTDTVLYRNAAGIVEITNGTFGTWRDLKLRNLLAGGGNGSYVQTPSMTVANLAAAATAGAGARAFVTDANATTYLSTVAGGGANKVPVVSDGTNWLIG